MGLLCSGALASVGSGERLPVGESWTGPQPPPGYHFECTQPPRGMPEPGLGTDGRWEASWVLEILCTFKKAEQVFFLQRHDY